MSPTLQPPPHRTVYLSAHFDDVALSCGGSVHADARAGRRPLVVTLCGEGPADGAPLSPLAESFHVQFGLGRDAVVARRLEDARAIACLGATQRWLAWPDAIYRLLANAPGWRYESDESMSAPPHAQDLGAVPTLARTLLDDPSIDRAAVFHAPLAAGLHVDHQVAHAVGRALAGAGREVWFYEDFPYVSWEPAEGASPDDPASLAVRIASLGSAPRRRVVALEDADWRARLAAVDAYASQLAMLFGDPATAGERQLAYAARVGAEAGGAGPHERFWAAAA